MKKSILLALVAALIGGCATGGFPFCAPAGEDSTQVEHNATCGAR